MPNWTDENGVSHFKEEPIHIILKCTVCKKEFSVSEAQAKMMRFTIITCSMHCALIAIEE